MELDYFVWRREIVAPNSGVLGHVDGMQIARILFESWNRYLSEGIGLSPEAVFDDRCRPILREMSTRFDAEVSAGDELTCGVRTSSRTARSFTLSQALWRRGSDIQVAAGSAVLVTIDVHTGRAVNVAPRLWAAMQSTDGSHADAEGR
jgi:acyl-CoA thioesterase FadM